jgi:hypothetical protein
MSRAYLLVRSFPAVNLLAILANNLIVRINKIFLTATILEKTFSVFDDNF